MGEGDIAMASPQDDAFRGPLDRLDDPAPREQISTSKHALPGLVALAGLPVLAGAWALLSADVMLLREMTWDFLFNLAGAWHLHYGHVPHVDFHEPVGQLNFLLTLLGFHVVGAAPQAFLVGAIVMASVLFAISVLATWHRLPVLPAAIFVVFVTLMALMPANVGDRPDTYSFAMSYNRYGWSAFSIIALILFMPPRNGMASGPSAMAAVGGLIVALFYLKVTYFAVSLAALALAVLVSAHVRARWLSWTVIGGLAIANAFAPYNMPYVMDILNAAAAGGVRSGVQLHLNKFLTHPLEVAPYVAATMVALWLWRTGRAPLRLPVAMGFLVLSGLMLLSQNAQTFGLPVGIVIVFLLYGQLAEQTGPHGSPAMTPALLALMVFPVLSTATAALSLAGYRFNAAQNEKIFVVDRTNLKGLAVPAEPAGLLSVFSERSAGPAMLNRARAVDPRYELTQYEYIETLLEAADFLSEPGRRRGGIVLLDQVNPLPFMLGVEPARDGNLWSGLGAPPQPADGLFDDAEHVLVPKFPTYSLWTNKAVALYRDYIAAHFAARQETRSWIIYSRAAGDSQRPAITLTPASTRPAAIGLPR